MNNFKEEAGRLVKVLEDKFGPEYQFNYIQHEDSIDLIVYKNDIIFTLGEIKDVKKANAICVLYFLDFCMPAYENTEDEYKALIDKLAEKAPYAEWRYINKPIENSGDIDYYTWDLGYTFGFDYDDDDQLVEGTEIMIKYVNLIHALTDEYEASHEGEKPLGYVDYEESDELDGE